MMRSGDCPFGRPESTKGPEEVDRGRRTARRERCPRRLVDVGEWSLVWNAAERCGESVRQEQTVLRGLATRGPLVTFLGELGGAREGEIPGGERCWIGQERNCDRWLLQPGWERRDQGKPLAGAEGPGRASAA